MKNMILVLLVALSFGGCKSMTMTAPSDTGDPPGPPPVCQWQPDFTCISEVMPFVFSDGTPVGATFQILALGHAPGSRVKAYPPGVMPMCTSAGCPRIKYRICGEENPLPGERPGWDGRIVIGIFQSWWSADGVNTAQSGPITGGIRRGECRQAAPGFDGSFTSFPFAPDSRWLIIRLLYQRWDSGRFVQEPVDLPINLSYEGY